jgi:hypothetical protein
MYSLYFGKKQWGYGTGRTSTGALNKPTGVKITG